MKRTFVFWLCLVALARGESQIHFAYPDAASSGGGRIVLIAKPEKIVIHRAGRSETRTVPPDFYPRCMDIAVELIREVSVRSQPSKKKEGDYVWSVHIFRDGDVISAHGYEEMPLQSKIQDLARESESGKKEPNKALEGTRLLVTFCADAQPAPSNRVPHLSFSQDR